MKKEQNKDEKKNQRNPFKSINALKDNKKNRNLKTEIVFIWSNSMTIKSLLTFYENSIAFTM